MKDTIFLLVRLVITHDHVRVHDAIAELQKDAVCTIAETENVRIEETKIMDYKLKNNA